MFSTVNYLLATYLQTKEAGDHKIVKVEKLRPGKARFYFNITVEHSQLLQMQFHKSVCSEFEALRKSTINLAY